MFDVVATMINHPPNHHKWVVGTIPKWVVYSCLNHISDITHLALNRHSQPLVSRRVEREPFLLIPHMGLSWNGGTPSSLDRLENPNLFYGWWLVGGTPRFRTPPYGFRLMNRYIYHRHQAPSSPPWVKSSAVAPTWPWQMQRRNGAIPPWTGTISWENEHLFAPFWFTSGYQMLPVFRPHTWICMAFAVFFLLYDYSYIISKHVFEHDSWTNCLSCLLILFQELHLKTSLKPTPWLPDQQALPDHGLESPVTIGKPFLMTQLSLARGCETAEFGVSVSNVGKETLASNALRFIMIHQPFINWAVLTREISRSITHYVWFHTDIHGCNWSVISFKQPKAHGFFTWKLHGWGHKRHLLRLPVLVTFERANKVANAIHSYLSWFIRKVSH